MSLDGKWKSLSFYIAENMCVKQLLAVNWIYLKTHELTSIFRFEKDQLWFRYNNVLGWKVIWKRLTVIINWMKWNVDNSSFLLWDEIFQVWLNPSITSNFTLLNVDISILIAKKNDELHSTSQQLVHVFGSKIPALFYVML